MKKPCERAMVIDYRDDRRLGITSALESANVDVAPQHGIVKRSGNGCHHSNLVEPHDLARMDVMFLHLRPCRLLKPNDMSGNECSMEFLRHHSALMRGKCLIAYGGKLEVPAGFDELRDPRWHRYIGGILSAESLAIKAFVHRWNEEAHPDALPPLGVLLPRSSPFVDDFRALLTLYQAGNAADTIQRPETWRKLFSEHAKELLQGLNLQAPDSPLVGLAQQMRDWFDDHPDVPHAAAQFDPKIHDALMATPAWTGANPS